MKAQDPQIIDKERILLSLFLTWIPGAIAVLIFYLGIKIVGTPINPIILLFIILIYLYGLYKIITMTIQVDNLYSNRFANIVLEPYWSIPIRQIQLLKAFEEYQMQKTTESEDLDKLFNTIKKDRKALYRYMQLKLSLVKQPLYKRKNYTRNCLLLSIVLTVLLFFCASMMKFYGYKNFQELLLHYLPNKLVANIAIGLIIYILYLGIEWLFNKIDFYKGGTIGALLTFRETRKAIKNPVLSKKFIIQYLINLLHARYGGDPRRKDYRQILFTDDFQYPEETTSTQSFLVIDKKGVTSYTFSTDPREPYHASNYKNLDDFISQTVSYDMAYLHHFYEFGLSNDIKHMKHLIDNTDEAFAFAKKDISIHMRSLSYQIPKILMKILPD